MERWSGSAEGPDTRLCSIPLSYCHLLSFLTLWKFLRNETFSPNDPYFHSQRPK
jgi:hypothetical protein